MTHYVSAVTACQPKPHAKASGIDAFFFATKSFSASSMPGSSGGAS